MSDTQSTNDNTNHNTNVSLSQTAASTPTRERKQKFDFTSLNSLAVVSLATALTSIGAVAAIIIGHISLAQLKRSDEAGRGLAITGLVLGYLTVATWITFGILALVLKAYVMPRMGFDPMGEDWSGIWLELDRSGHMHDR
jgi:lysylphosphatidylglycerol synthetase-like protein (DUF2156 family)